MFYKKRVVREEMTVDDMRLEEKLVAQAKKTAELIKNEIPIPFYDKLCSTIAMCQNYVEGKDGLDWEDVYDEIYQGEWKDDEEDGIYLMSQYIDTSEEVMLLLALPIEILSYVCWLGCKAKNDIFPEDLELVIGDRIPDFVIFLEENLKSKEDFEKAIDFANKNLCY